MSTSRAPSPYASRPHVAARLLTFLRAGFLVRIGSNVYALRRAGEQIEDEMAEFVYEANVDGLFQQVEKHTYQSSALVNKEYAWMLRGSYDCERILNRDLADLTDEAVESIMLNLIWVHANMENKTIAQAMHTGVRLANPPTTIVG